MSWPIKWDFICICFRVARKELSRLEGWTEDIVQTVEGWTEDIAENLL